MIARGFFIFTIGLLANCVLSLPVTQSGLENEDVKVMKCIVEALAYVLSRPHPLPVSQECLDTLRTDERLVSILRHRNFLKELQDIAVQGSNERAQKPGDIIADHVTRTPQTPQSAEDVADRSMLEALGGPGERSILAQKRGAGEGEEESTEKDGQTQEGNEIRGTAEEENRPKDENPDNHISDSMNEEEDAGDAGDAGAEEEKEGEEDEEEKRERSEEDSEENGGEGDSVTEARKDTKSNEKSDAPERSEEKKSAEEEEEEEEEEEDAEKKRSALLLRDSAEAEKEKEEEEEEEEEEEVKRESGERSRRRGGKSEPAGSSQTRRRAGGAERQEVRSLEVTGQREVPHHSQEVTREEEDEERKVGGERRSPEEKELRMMAARAPEERRGGEEEGSASRKTEDPEIESLAAIESELEKVAQKLHKLRRG